MTETLAAPASGSIVLLPLDQITVDPSLQVRSSGLNESHAAGLAALLERDDEGHGRDLDPIEVVAISDPLTGAVVYKVAHGHHRRRAYEIAKIMAIPAIVIEGDDALALETAIRGNVKNGLPWPEAERRMVLRKLIAEEPYERWSFTRLAELTGLGYKAVRTEWVAMYPGVTEREYIGADGKTYTQKIGVGSRKAPVVAPQALDTEDLDDAYDAFSPPSAAQPAAKPTPPVASTQTYHAPPSLNGHGGGSPSPSPASSGAPGSYAQIKRPTFVHKTQVITRIDLSYQQADDTLGTLELVWEDGVLNLGDQEVSRALRAALIALLEQY